MQREVIRSIAVTLITAVSVAAGFLALTSLPRWITLVASVALGSLALFLDLTFLRTAEPATGRRPTLAILGAVATIFGLVATFAIGRHTQADPPTYPFVITGTGGFVLIKSVPVETAATGDTLDAGTTVEIVCQREVRGAVWYQLPASRGWLSEVDAIPAPYSGAGSPPVCPD